jgi:hypothetical protein
VSGPSEEAKACPSTRVHEGAILLGIVGPEGRVAYLTPETRVDEEFVKAVQNRGRPEKRFRFASRCVEDGCGHWTGNRCGVIQQALESDLDQAVTDARGPLPACAIRPRCRWFGQEGRRACAVCPLIVHDQT